MHRGGLWAAFGVLGALWWGGCGAPAPQVGSDPAPAVGDPAPAGGDPAPAVGDPAPAVGDPAPAVGDPAPVEMLSARVLAADDALVGAWGLRAGDLWISGPHLHAAIAGPQHPGPVGVGGQLLLLGVGPTPTGRFGDASPVFDADGRLGFEAHTIEIESAQPLVIKAKGQVAGDEDLRATLHYRFEAAEPTLEVSMAVRNRAPGRHPRFSLGWAVRWGQLQPFVPEGQAAGAALRSDSDWVGGEGTDLALLFTWQAGRVFAHHGPGWSVLGASARELKPRESRAGVARFRLDAQRSLGALSAEVLQARGAVIERDEGIVVDAAQRPQAGAWVSLLDRQGQRLAQARTDAQGHFELWARPGQDRQLAVSWRPSAPGLRIARPPSRGAPLRLLAPPVASVAVRVVDERGEPLPSELRLSPPKGLAEEPARTLPEGAQTLKLSPGVWRIQAMAGPERRSEIVQLALEAGQAQTLVLALDRVLERQHWRALDAHFALPPGQAGTQRLRSCAAFGVDAVVAPGAAAQAEQSGVRVLPAALLSVDDRARFAAWGGEGQPRIAGDAAQILDSAGARGWWRAVLRPRSPGAGYFRRYGFKNAQAPLPSGGFSLAFEGLELGGPDPRGALDELSEDWLSLRRAGHAVRALGGSAGDPGAACGAARTWIWHEGPLESAEDWHRALASAPGCVSRGARTRLEWVGPRQVRLTIEAAPQHRPVEASLEGPAGRLLRVALPEGEGALSHTQLIELPQAAAWVVARTRGPKGAGYTQDLGWSITQPVYAP